MVTNFSELESTSPGDVDGDGSVDLIDALIALQVLVGLLRLMFTLCPMLITTE